jgi:hypothetical protein
VDYRDDVTEGEEVLGLGSANRVWRVGDTIRRSRWPSSDTTAALLRHLEHKSFRYSPHYLGIDGLGRDVLSLLPGAPMATLRGDDQLVQVSRLLRELHDATADFIPPVGAVWQVEPGPAGPGGGRIIHRDVAAWNLLENGDVITGLADWDLAGPGRLIEDFAYVAWHFAPLHPEPMGDGSSGPAVADRPRRLRILADSYGLTADERQTVLGEVAAMQVRQATRIADGALAGDEVSVRLWRAGRFTENTGRSLSWLAEHRDSLTRALNCR